MSSVPPGCLPFDFQKVKEGAEVVLYKGGVIHDAKFLFYDDITKGSCKYLFLIKGELNYFTWWTDEKGFDVLGSIYLKQITKKYWTNIYKTSDSFNRTVGVYLSKAHAIKNVSDTLCYVDTVSFELDCIKRESKPKTKTLWVAIEKDIQKWSTYNAHSTSLCYETEERLLEVLKGDENYWIKSVEVPCE